MAVLSARHPGATTLDDRMDYAYNEQAFRHLLAVERRRAARSHRSFLLVLVTIRHHPALRRRIPAPVASAIFSGLCVSIREVDFVGWFRADRVAAAVLTQGTDPLSSDAAQQIGQRITDTLRDAIPLGTGGRLHVRVLQLQSSREA